MQPQVEFKFISFFSGALGLDLGLEQAGLQPMAANEYDPVICQTIRLNRPSLRLYEADIRNLNADEIFQNLNIQPGELFLINGGPPCQAFSTAGRRLGLNDERGNVFLYFIDMIGYLMPKYVVMENVRGLLSVPLKHRPHDERGSEYPPLSAEENSGGALKHIIDKLNAYGYRISFNLYNTANFGVPQIRERIIMFGSRDGDAVPDLVPTHDEHGRCGLPLWKTFADAVLDLKPPFNHVNFSEKRLHYYRMLGPGQNWRDLPDSLKPEAMGKSYFAGGGKTGFFRRLAWDRPSPTVVTRPNMPATDLAHPVEDRPLSVEEYARIQTFPDSWQFAGNILDQYKQIGNAVPVKFGQAIGEHLIAFDSGLVDETSQVSIPLSRYKGTSHKSWLATMRDQQEKFNQLPLV